MNHITSRTIEPYNLLKIQIKIFDHFFSKKVQILTDFTKIPSSPKKTEKEHVEKHWKLNFDICFRFFSNEFLRNRKNWIS